MYGYNSEGYPDPTAHAALANIAREEKMKRRKEREQVKKYRPLVYIASPYAGDTERNIEKARAYCRFAVRQGCIPLAPHLFFPQFMDERDKEQRELGLRFALILLGKCEQLWVCGDVISDGMKAEIAKAKKRGIPIKYYGRAKDGA